MENSSYTDEASASAGYSSAQSSSYTSKDLQIVLSYGQSLAVGSVTATRPISTSAIYSGQVVEVAQTPSGVPSFTDLKATNKAEPPLISALNRMAANFSRDGITAPTLVGAMEGVSGQPLVKLYLGSTDKYASTSDGLLATADGEFFYTFDASRNRFDIYLNQGGTAVTVSSDDIEPNHFDKVIASFHAIKAAADNGGYTITDRLLFSFIQGQGDTKDYASKTYSSLLSDLVARIDAAADHIFGKDIEIVTVMGQSRNPYVSKQQLHFVATTPNSYLGALEAPYQAENSSVHNYITGQTSGRVASHLNPLGYNMLGQETGDVLYKALIGSADEDDFIRIDSVSVEGNLIVVSFAGLEGCLFEDNTIFGPAVGGLPPANLGFYLYGNSKYSIVDADITGPNEVTLTVNRSVDRSFSLILGDSNYLSDGSKNSFGGTPLRDSVTKPVDNPFSILQISDRAIKKFAPDQKVTLDKHGLISGTLETTATVRSRSLVNGTSGDDDLAGSSASDALQGNAGNDRLDGGVGYDLLTGGAGTDSFVFSDFGRADTIADFTPADGDLIDLTAIFVGQSLDASVIDQYLELETVDSNTTRLLVNQDGRDGDFETLALINHTAGTLDLSTLLSQGSLVF